MFMNNLDLGFMKGPLDGSALEKFKDVAFPCYSDKVAQSEH